MAVSAKPPSQEAAAEFKTLSGEPVRELYTDADLPPGIGSEQDPIGRPGAYPFTRGIYESMYRGRLWTMRQFAGFGTERGDQRALPLPARRTARRGSRRRSTCPR